MAAGEQHTCAIVASGAPLCWGENLVGQLGDGSAAARRAPVAVAVASTPLAGKTMNNVAAGPRHTCAAATDSTLACWGSNSWGGIGNGTTTGATKPTATTRSGTPLAGRTITQLAVGDGHSCALASANTVACWGLNSQGQVGNGTTSNALVPVAVTTTGTPLAGKTIVQIASGLSHTCALASDSTIACWGANASGQLGRGSTSSSSIPIAVSRAGTPLAGKTITRIAAGAEGTCALASDSTLACWGANSYGQVGNGTTTSPTTGVTAPVAVTRTGTALAGKVITQVAVGWYHACALTSDSTVACWGRNETNAQLGDGTYTNRLTAVAVIETGTPLAGHAIAELTLGRGHSCALTDDGPACWGDLGQVGLGWDGDSPRALPVLRGALGDEPVDRVAVGLAHACAATEAGSVACWGDNAYGQYGTLAAPVSETPVAVPTSRPVNGEMTAGDFHTCANDTGAGVTCWGANNRSQTGSPPSPTRPPTIFNLPQAAQPGSPYQLAAGTDHTCLTARFRAIFCWGANAAGQLGNGTTTDAPTRTLATEIGTPWQAKEPYSLAAGEAHTCALTQGATTSHPETYTPVCWGANADGQLGNGTTTASLTPAKVSLTAAIAGRTLVQMTAGSRHTCVLASDSRIACWGANASGQLGNGTTVAFGTPIAVVTAATALAGRTLTQIVAGAAHTCALASDGTVACWGANNRGQLGDGTRTPSSLPITVTRVDTPLAGRQVAKLAAHGDQTCAIASDGTVACWGDNEFGDLGAGPVANARFAVAVDITPPWAPFESWDDLVSSISSSLLGRPPTASEASSWRSQLTSGSASAASLVASLRGTTDHTGNVDPVARLYRAYFLRIPDVSGLRYWIGQKRGGRSLDSISQAFAGSAEFRARYGSLSNRQFVEQVYRNVLGRPGETGGVNYWIAQLDSGARTRGRVMTGFSESSEYKRTQVGEVATAVLFILLLDRAPTLAEHAAGVSRVEGLGTTTFAESILPSVLPR